jgi:hypothetical protein
MHKLLQTLHPAEARAGHDTLNTVVNMSARLKAEHQLLKVQMDEIHLLAEVSSRAEHQHDADDRQGAQQHGD